MLPISTKKQVMIIVTTAIITLSLFADFGDVILLNEEQTQPNLPKAIFNSANGSTILDGQIYAVFTVPSEEDRQSTESLVFARPQIHDGKLSFHRTVLDTYEVPSYRPLIGTPEPAITATPQGDFVIVYPKTHADGDGKISYNLHRLIVDKFGSITANDILDKNVVSTSQLITTNSKVNLLYKQGAPVVNLNQFHQFSDQFSGLDGSPERVRFFSGEVIHGKVHSNTDIWIDGIDPPKFYDLVTTSGSIKVVDNEECSFNEIFLGGLIENYPPIELMTDAQEIKQYVRLPFSDIERDDCIAYVTVDGEFYTSMIGQIVVEDTEDPDFEWIEDYNMFAIHNSYPPYGDVGESIGVNRIPKIDTIWTQGPAGTLYENGVFVPMELWLSGNFSGRQTWLSSHDIYLKGDLIYTNTEPGLPPDGGINKEYPVNETDYLTVVSEKSIYIQYGRKSPIDSLRYRPNTEGIYMYGSYYALGKGENAWEDGNITYQYQYPKGSTPNQIWRGELYKNIDLHLFQYPTTTENPWPPGLDYPWYNPLWPEPGTVYNVPNIDIINNPHGHPEIVKQRGDIKLFGSLAQRRIGYMNRSGDEDFDTGIWDIHNTINPDTPPQYGAPNPSIGPTGYNKVYQPDRRLTKESYPFYIPTYDLVNPRRRKLNFKTSTDGEEFTQALSKGLLLFDECVAMDVYRNSTALLVDRTLYLFTEGTTGYVKKEISISYDAKVKEMILTDNGLYILTTSFDGKAVYLSKLYHFDIKDEDLTKIDEKIHYNLMQAIHLFDNSVLWAAAKDKGVIINQYGFNGTPKEFTTWVHDIDFPDYFSRDKSSLSLKSEGDMLFITFTFRELGPKPEYNYNIALPQGVGLDMGGDVYVAYGYFGTTSIDKEEKKIMLPSFSLSHFPNPLSRNDFLEGKTMNIDFTLPANSNIKINVYNIKGQLVTSLTDNDYQAGSHSVRWDGRDKNNDFVSSGVYFYQMKTENKTHNKKMLIVR